MCVCVCVFPVGVKWFGQAEKGSLLNEFKHLNNFESLNGVCLMERCENESMREGISINIYLEIQILFWHKASPGQFNILCSDEIWGWFSWKEDLHPFVSSPLLILIWLKINYLKMLFLLFHWEILIGSVCGVFIKNMLLLFFSPFYSFVFLMFLEF